MNNIFAFLLPHTTLDWFFFSLLLGWLAFSLVAAKKAKNNIQVIITFNNNFHQYDETFFQNN